MKIPFKTGDTKTYLITIKESDVAAFHGKVVHSVCSTFALARNIEWSSRLFVLEMKEPDEEGIGTMLTIEHKSPAFVGEELMIEAKIENIKGNELICTYIASVGERIVAFGKTGQKVLKKKKIETLFAK